MVVGSHRPPSADPCRVLAGIVGRARRLLRGVRRRPEDAEPEAAGQVPRGELALDAVAGRVRTALAHAQAVALVESFLRFPVQEGTTDVMLSALTTCRRFRISYWDAAILEAGRASGCDVVWSEDLVDGTDHDGVRVENPFTSS